MIFLKKNIRLFIILFGSISVITINYASTKPSHRNINTTHVKVANSSDTIDKNISTDYISVLLKDKFMGSRTSHWYYGWIIYKNYPVSKKIFGGGFDYMKMYGDEFKETELDYPHNPFISAFLYSGILGGLAYIWFILLVFKYYIKYVKHHLYFFVCFLIVFFFSFFSGNTHFSIPIFTILCFIPFFTKYIIEKEEVNK